jgi:hypothetical protein
MSRKSQPTLTVAADEGGGSTPLPPSPTITYYQQVADTAMKAMNELLAALPPLETSHPATADFVRGHSNVSLPDLAIVVSHVDQQPRLRVANTLDPVRGRDTLQYAEAFEPLAEKLITAGNALRFTVRARVAELTANAQQTGAVAQALARDPASANLHPISQSIKHALNKKRSRKKKEATPAETAKAA